MKLNNDGSYTDPEGQRFVRLVCNTCGCCGDLWVNAEDDSDIVCLGCLEKERKGWEKPES